MKKGFTLIEVLAVVTIIGLIFVIALPKIINSLNSKKSDIDNTTNNMIISAAKMYVNDHNTKFDKIEGVVYCLPLTTLTKEEYLDSKVKNVTDDKDITNIKSVKISYDNTFHYEIVNKKDCLVKKIYTELNYLESTGTQYIDTGIPANMFVDPKFEVKMKITSSKLNDYALNGSYVYGQAVQFGLVVTSSTKARVTMNCGFASPVGYTDVNKNDFHTLYLSNGLQKVDNIVIGESSIINVEENNYNFYLFGRNGDKTYRDNYAMKIVYFKLWDNNDLVRDLIPVLDKNNVACMYDKANKKFYYNQGTGEFLYG